MGLFKKGDDSSFICDVTDLDLHLLLLWQLVVSFDHDGKCVCIDGFWNRKKTSHTNNQPPDMFVSIPFFSIGNVGIDENMVPEMFYEGKYIYVYLNYMYSRRKYYLLKTLALVLSKRHRIYLNSQ
jgi:hypothetical protein